MSPLFTDSKILRSPVGRLQGFELYGMQYLFMTKQVKGEIGKSCKYILAGDVQKRSLERLLETGTITQRDLELLAVDCISAFYGHMEFGLDDTNLQVYGNEKYVVSTARGTIAIVTDMGGVYNLLAKDPRDVFLFKRYLDEFPCNYGIVEVGSRTHCFYEKLGYDMEDIDSKHNNASMVRFNFLSDSKARDVRELAKKYNLTLWFQE